MWIVRLALRRTYTFVVAALLIAVLGAVSIYRMSTDIFPNIDIPVVSVVWQYFGMPADEIETRILLINERVLTASVNDIEHIESQSLDGVGVIRIFFQPGAKIAEAQAQVTATWQTLLKIMPPGITPRTSSATPPRPASRSTRPPSSGSRICKGSKRSPPPSRASSRRGTWTRAT